jgi:hypothetical protein
MGVRTLLERVIDLEERLGRLENLLRVVIADLERRKDSGGKKGIK